MIELAELLKSFDDENEEDENEEDENEQNDETNNDDENEQDENTISTAASISVSDDYQKLLQFERRNYESVLPTIYYEQIGRW